jgi:hypothetical protein
MSEVKFTKDIIGSPNGIIVNEYKEGQIINDVELGEYLKTVWTEAKIIVPVTAKANAKADADADADGEGAGENDKDKDKDELTEKQIGEYVYQAKEILEAPNGEDGEVLSAEDIAKLKEIGIALKIAGMVTSKNPQTILDKINKYIDEYEEAGAGEGEDGEGAGENDAPEGEEEIPE